jgi:hypothetical protein
VPGAGHAGEKQGWRLGSDPVAIGDIDGDGRAEVVISKGDWLGVLRWDGAGLVCDGWMGHEWVPGAGHAGEKQGWRLGSDPVAIGDIDGDGRAEPCFAKDAWLGLLRWDINALVCSSWMGHRWVNHADNDASFAVALTHSGWVDGWTTSTSPKRNDDWDEFHTNAAVARAFTRLRSPRLDVAQSSRGTITTHLSDLLDLLSVTAIASLLGPDLVLGVVLVGEAASMVTSGGSAIPGAQILHGILWMTGLSGLAYAFPVGLVTLGKRSRGLTDKEWIFAEAVFQGTLPDRADIVVTDSIFGTERDNADDDTSRPFTWPSSEDRRIMVNLGSHGYDDALWVRGADDGSRPHSLQRGETLIHELVHAWQYRNCSWHVGWMAEAAVTVCKGEAVYEYDLDGRDFAGYGTEQQAQIISDWHGINAQVSGQGDQEALALDGSTDPAFRYVALNIRTGAGA